MQLLGSFAEFEHTMIREYAKAGLETARKQGRIGGRKPKLTAEQRRIIVSRADSGICSEAEAVRFFSVHPSTITRLLIRDLHYDPI